MSESNVQELANTAWAFATVKQPEDWKVQRYPHLKFGDPMDLKELHGA